MLHQVVEDAVHALGRIAVGDHNGTVADTVLTALLEQVGNKQEELQVIILSASLAVCF